MAAAGQWGAAKWRRRGGRRRIWRGEAVARPPRWEEALKKRRGEIRGVSVVQIRKERCLYKVSARVRGL